MASGYLLEDGSGRYLLEDGSGIYLLEHYTISAIAVAQVDGNQGGVSVSEKQGAATVDDNQATAITNGI